MNIQHIQFEIILADHNKINDLRDVYQFAKNEFDFRELFSAVWQSNSAIEGWNEKKRKEKSYKRKEKK